MRQVLVEHARGRGAAKRGGDACKLTLDEAIDLPKSRDLDLIALDEALKLLATMDALQSSVVELRFFAGLSLEDVADCPLKAPATKPSSVDRIRSAVYSKLNLRSSSGDKPKAHGSVSSASKRRFQ